VTTSTAADQGSGDPLLDLHRSGDLVARYPEVPALLAQLSDERLVRAGQLLARLEPGEVLAAHPSAPSISVAITGHGTLGPLVAPLTAECARHGMVLRPHLAEFDSYVFDLADPDGPLYAADPDLTLCVLDPAVVFDEVPVPWRPAEVARVLDAKLDLLARLADTFQTTARGTLVLNTLPLPRCYPTQLIDLASRAELGAVWREANARLLRLGEGRPSLVVLDLDPLLAEGLPAVDPRMDVYAKAHLSGALLAAYAREVGHLARHVSGLTKKCLALDLDGTVWGGVLGDDGIDGIDVSEGYRGEAHRGFQRVAKQIGSQGVLLTAVSKNDSDAVRQVLREHAGMTLREEDFVRVVANWRPKHDNLAETAAELNLNPDSFVFVDDSPFECGLIRQAMPGTAVVQLDTEPALHTHKLLRDGWFTVRQLTAEDRGRVATYRQEAACKDFLDTFSSVEDYLRELGVQVRIGPAEPGQVLRVSQLSLRTNQFNLTTRRMQAQDVVEYAAAPGALVLAVHSADRFGDNGLVGVLFLRRVDDAVHIDNFLLSCRVFSRGIEQACLASVLDHARSTGARAVYGAYRPTAKNGVVRDLYRRYGFAEAEQGDGTTAFRHDLVDPVTTPDHIRLTDRIGVDIA
jgi:FkbH-like protein